MNEHKLKIPSSFCSRWGLSVGDPLLIITSEQLVVVKATSMPAETKSSKYEKGIKVANIVMVTPANRAPFLGNPLLSISQNTGGKRPSFAEDR